MKTITNTEQDRGYYRTMILGVTALIMILAGMILDDSIGVLHHILLVFGGLVLGYAERK